MSNLCFSSCLWHVSHTCHRQFEKQRFDTILIPYITSILLKLLSILWLTFVTKHVKDEKRFSNKGTNRWVSVSCTGSDCLNIEPYQTSQSLHILFCSIDPTNLGQFSKPGTDLKSAGSDVFKRPTTCPIWPSLGWDIWGRLKTHDAIPLFSW